MSSSLFTAQLYPGQALGFMVLGASLHDILTRLKAEPQRFPKLDVIFSAEAPIKEPVMVNLPHNGVRLRFDGPEQRLRLIEVIDFTKNHITYKEQNNERDLVRPPAPGTAAADGTTTTAGPSFKHIYNKFLGPTYDGEFIGGGSADPDQGIYVLSYPGCAFTFPMPRSEWAASPTKDLMGLLSRNGVQTATSMAVFSGDSWAQARETLWTEVLPSLKTFPHLHHLVAVAGSSGPNSSSGSNSASSSSASNNAAATTSAKAETWPDEVSLVRIHGGGKLQLFRKWTSASTWITLGETSPQDLVAELGPPDAIYRKSDTRMNIHRPRAPSSSRSRRPDDLRQGGGSSGGVATGGGTLGDVMTDTELSGNTASEEDDDDDDDGSVDSRTGGAVDDDDGDGSGLSSECFYNYFYLGFDVLVSTPKTPSQPPPSVVRREQAQQEAADLAAAQGKLAALSVSDPADQPPFKVRNTSADRQVAVKVIIQGNVPGSYPFNRHRRCRWEIAYLNTPASDSFSQQKPPCNSEMPFSQTEERLQEEWRPFYASDAEARQFQRGMKLNRGWGDSPGSSIELLGGWDGASGTVSGDAGGPSHVEAAMNLGAARGGGGGGSSAAAASKGRKVEGTENSTTTLYGFPGLVFEVLRNGFVSSLTVF